MFAPLAPAWVGVRLSQAGFLLAARVPLSARTLSERSHLSCWHPAPQFIDEQHPPVFRPINWGRFRSLRFAGESLPQGLVTATGWRAGRLACLLLPANPSAQAVRGCCFMAAC